MYKSLWLVALFNVYVLAAPKATVILDPGHGGKFPGCVSPQKLLVEKTLALDIARRVGNILKKQGIKVVLTRNEDKHFDPNLSEDLEKRVAIGAKEKNAVFVSIHLNAAESAKKRGYEVYVPMVEQCPAESYKLAACIHHQFSQQRESDIANNGRNRRDRGIRAAKFRVLSKATCPAVLVEVDFISNPDVEKELHETANKQKAAAIIAQGIVKYLQ